MKKDKTMTLEKAKKRPAFVDDVLMQIDASARDVEKGRVRKVSL